MATELQTNSTNNEITEFDSVAIEIMNVFNPLIAELIARRDSLLKGLSILKSDYTDKEEMRKNSIEEIVVAQRLMDQLSLKDNTNIYVHKETIRLYEERLIQLETPTKLQCPYFNYSRLTSLQTLIKAFGEISVTGPEDSLKIDKPQNKEIISSLVSSTKQPRDLTSSKDPDNTGCLAITIVKADLNQSYSVLPSPYCKLTIDDVEYLSSCEIGQTPEWNIRFDIDLQINTTGLDIEIFDLKVFSDDLRIAWTHIEIPTAVLYGVLVKQSFPLDGKLGEGKEGSILLSFKLN
ncbi:ToLlIp-like [Oopsacas minuta]|uniref:ToLlIp-like n=1 Tax=Oopsacas minuta TaxID=111878 RepID=A0AAV7JPW6_9METZ|nr:ToLlIp-like [Oopsacas minuta]